MRSVGVLLLAIAGVVSMPPGGVRAAGEYPLTLVLDAQAKSGSTNITSKITIHVDHLMEERDRKAAADGLKYGGYIKFFDALRGIPPIGTIAVDKRTVDVQYAREQPDEAGRRLVLVANKPLFFINADEKKSRTGYALTVVDLKFDGKGGVSGTMAGAARVKPTPDSGVVLDDFAATPVQLSGREAPAKK